MLLQERQNVNGSTASRRLRAAAPFVPLALLMAIVVAPPLWTLIRYAFLENGVKQWSVFVDTPSQVNAVMRTLVVAAETTAVCILLGYLYVGALLTARPAVRNALLAATLIPFFTSILVRTYGWIILLGNEGPMTRVYRAITGSDAPDPLIYNRFGILVGMVHVLIPFFILPLYAVMSQTPARLHKAARTLGANRVEAWLRVDLPLSLPGATAGALLVFILSLGFFITPALLGGSNDLMVSQVIDNLLSLSVDLNAAAVLAVVLLVAVLICLALFRLVYPLELLFVQDATTVRSRRARRRNRAPGAFTLPWLAGTRLRVTTLLSRAPWRGIATVAAGAIAVYFLAPLLVVIPVSFSGESVVRFPPKSLSLQWYDAVISDAGWRSAALNSLATGLLSTTIALAVALPLAFALVRSPLRPQIKGGILAITLITAILPIVVLALAVYLWFLKIHAIGNLVPLAAAHAVLGLPFALVILMAALRDFDRSLERAARSLGASAARTIRLITVPMLRPALLAAMLFAFLQSFDELLIARAATDVDTRTLPVKIWDGAREALSPLLGAVSVLFIAAALLAVLLAAAVQGARRSRNAR